MMTERENMDGKHSRLVISAEDTELLLVIIVYGVLKAIEGGFWNSDAGIWTIGRPKFWKPLIKNGLVSTDIVEIMQSADELSAIKLLCGKDQLVEVLHQQLEVLESKLKALQETSFDLVWDMTETTGINESGKSDE